MVTNSFENEHELILAFQKKDAKAVECIFQQCYATLVDFATQFVRDSAEAQDIAINSFIKLLDRSVHLESLNNVRAFLFVATRNSCIDHLKKVEVKARYQKEAAFLAEPLDEQKQYDLVRMDAEIISALYNEIDNLPAQCKRIFEMHFLRNFDNHEIANQLNLSVQTVKNQLTRAKGKLRTALDKKKLLYATASLIILKFSILFC